MNSEKKIKVLNLYAGIGGNRRNWKNVEVTAVEKDKSISQIYRDLYPIDTVVNGDAHQYLLDHMNEFDFIWASPPCPTHSKLAVVNVSRGTKLKYPDMKLYQEILILKHFFKGKWVVENVRSYYKPLIPPQESARHYFWSNFKIPNIHVEAPPIMGISGFTQDLRMKASGYDIKDFHGFKGRKEVLFKNCVSAELGSVILDRARNIIERPNATQQLIFNADCSQSGELIL